MAYWLKALRNLVIGFMLGITAVALILGFAVACIRLGIKVQ